MKLNACLAIIALMILTFSCKKDEDDSCGKTLVEITDDIVVPTTWTSDNIYVISSGNIWVENTLTILPGTVVKFRGGYGLEVQLNGTIMANGTLSDPIIFTSIKDDSHGCDDNNDGNSSSPSAKDWSRILVTTDGSVFNHCHFYFGGGNTWQSTLETREVMITITNCEFVDNAGGVYLGSFYGALTAWNASPSSIINDNTFYRNILPLSVNASINLGEGNGFSNPDNSTETNVMNGIFVYGDIEVNTSWSDTEVPFVSEASTLFVRAPWSLTDGVIVKITEGNSITILDGGEMTFSDQVIFTSFKDDNNGGDTNGDGTASSPTKGDWEGIWDPRIPGNTFYLSGSNILFAEKP